MTTRPNQCPKCRGQLLWDRLLDVWACLQCGRELHAPAPVTLPEPEPTRTCAVHGTPNVRNRYGQHCPACMSTHGKRAPRGPQIHLQPAKAVADLTWLVTA